MDANYQARWISKNQLTALRKTGTVRQGVLVHHLNGMVIVEPVGSKLGEGKVLARDMADYELRPVWCLDPTPQLGDARRRLGLKAEGGVVRSRSLSRAPRGRGHRPI
jgi:hypothetical protein